MSDWMHKIIGVFKDPEKGLDALTACAEFAAATNTLLEHQQAYGANPTPAQQAQLNQDAALAGAKGVLAVQKIVDAVENILGVAANVVALKADVTACKQLVDSINADIAAGRGIDPAKIAQLTSKGLNVGADLIGIFKAAGVKLGPVAEAADLPLALFALDIELTLKLIDAIREDPPHAIDYNIAFGPHMRHVDYHIDNAGIIDTLNGHPPVVYVFGGNNPNTLSNVEFIQNPDNSVTVHWSSKNGKVNQYLKFPDPSKVGYVLSIDGKGTITYAISDKKPGAGFPFGMTNNVDGTKTITTGGKQYNIKANAEVTVGTNDHITVKQTNDDGTITTLDLSVNATTGDVEMTSTGSLAAVKVRNYVNILLKPETYGDIGGAIGATLGNALANGNKVEGILFSSLLGVIGKDLATGIATGIKTESSIGAAINSEFANFAQQLNVSLGSGVTNAASSILVGQLVKDLGISGFGGELLTSVGSDVVAKVLIASQGAGPTGGIIGILSKGWDVGKIFKWDTWATAFKKAVSPNSIGSFFGAKLGSLVLAPQTQAAAILGSLGAQIGSMVGQEFIPIPGVGAFIGSFIGEILGTFIGNLFGQKKPKIPTAGAETVLNLPYAQYRLGAVTSTNGGQTDVVVQMAQTAAKSLNGLIAQVTGGGLTPHFVSNSAAPTMTFGYNGSTGYYYKLGAGGSAVSVTSADVAVDKAVLWALPQTQIIGGDIFIKRAFLNSTAADVVSLLGELQIASDYGNYAADRATVDAYISTAYGKLNPSETAYYAANKILVDNIDMNGLAALTPSDLAIYNGTTQVVGSGATQTLATAQDIANGLAHGVATSLLINDILTALQSQALANPWIITLDRADELKLGKWAVSDFYGGAAGFLQSFGFGLPGATVRFEDVKLTWDGTNLTFADSVAAGVFSVLNQASTDGKSVTINAFAATMGYSSAAMNTLTTGNTIESGTANFSNAGRAGYNIFLGGNSGNQITAGTNDTWIQGGAGTDTLRGGSGHDVIIAGTGNTTIYGGDAGYYSNDTGGSYLAGGSGTTTINGGAKNDIIALGTGITYVAAGAGDDLILLTGTTGSGTIDGGTGNNTLSLERFIHGVTVNMGAYSSGDAHFYTSILNIQNLIGASVGGNVLTAAGTGVNLTGGVAADTFYGVSGGRTGVSYANSGLGVIVDLSMLRSDGYYGVSYGGTAVKDVFYNIVNVTGSTYDDDLKSVAGATLNGGSGGNDWFSYSGGGNAYIGSLNGSNAIDYSAAPGALTINFTAGTAQVAGKTADTISNITRLIGSRQGSTVTGTSGYTQTLDSNGNVVSTTMTNLGIWFAPAGGTNTVSGSGSTIEFNAGSGTTTVNGNGSLAFGSNMSYDNVWLSYQTIETISAPNPHVYFTFSDQVTFGVRGASDQVTFKYGTANMFAGMTTLAMNGASTLDLSRITTVAGPQTVVEREGDDVRPTKITTTGGGSTVLLTGTVDGSSTGNVLIVTGSGSKDTNGNVVYTSVINVDAGAATTNGSVVIAGRAGTGGMTINTSAGDDQFTYEAGDGHYTINGTGGQKMIAFGSSVDSDDVIYNIVGNDLYIGLRNQANGDQTADQVADSIRIVNGAVGSVVSGAFALNNAYFYQAEGSVVDLSKLTIGYKLSLTTSTTVAASNVAISVGNSLTDTIIGDDNTVTGGTGDNLTFNGNGNVFTANAGTTGQALTLSGTSSSVTLNSSTVNLTTAGNNVTVTGNNDTINVTGSGSTVTVHGTGLVVNASGATIYKGNTSSVTVNGTGNTVVTLGVAPIVFDLDGAGLELTPVASSTLVTTASNGALTRLGWFGPTNGILVTDRNGDGQYGDVSDISFIGDKPGARSDLEGLAAWDSDGDGRISAADTGWSKLNIWVDANMDGISSAGEVKSLDAAGIGSIALARSLTGADGTMTSDSYASATARFTRADGTAGNVYDVTLGQQVMSDAGWTSLYGTTAAQLSGGALGHLTAGGIDLTAATSVDPSLAAIWRRLLDPTGTASSAVTGSGDAIDSNQPNRGGRIATQRLQVLDLDLSGKGPDIVDADHAGVTLDVNRSGDPFATAWVGRSDSLLVADTHGDGHIDPTAEATFQALVPYARTSLAGLTAFDSNSDGTLDGNDAGFARLCLWTDANGDGASQTGELRTLTQAGVVSISLEADPLAVDTRTLSESEVLARATATLRDGSTRSLFDIALALKGPKAVAADDKSEAELDAAVSLSAPIDATPSAAAAPRLTTALSAPSAGTAGRVSLARRSNGLLDQITTSDGGGDDTASGGAWWTGNAVGLSDSIERFHDRTPQVESIQPTHVSQAGDAATAQRQLMLRQAMAGFSGTGAPAAVFQRRGQLDLLNPLAARIDSRSNAAIDPRHAA